MINLLKNLINAPSTSYTGELNSARTLADYFTANGIEADIDVWDQVRANCTVHIKSTNEKPALLFAGHIDVVPPGDQQWDFPPFEAREIDGRISGRGSTDMKAGIAAVAASITEVISEADSTLKGDLIFTSTAGEETDSCGIKRFVKCYADAIPELAGIIIPEPTNFDTITAHRGILWLDITTKGKTAHGSMPHEGINAINHMTSLLNSLKNIKIDYRTHPRLGSCTMSINQIHAGNATNVIPDTCTISIDIRTLPNQAHQQILDQFNKICADLHQQNNDFNAEVEIERSVEAMESDDTDDFITTFCRITGALETKTAGYTTDAPYLSQLNTPIAIFGPGDSSVCHKPNEYVEIKEVKKAKHFYKNIIKHYLT